jgi:hypothetical protein
LTIPVSVFLCVEQDPQRIHDTFRSKDDTFHCGSTIPCVKGLAGLPIVICSTGLENNRAAWIVAGLDISHPCDS